MPVGEHRVGVVEDAVRLGGVLVVVVEVSHSFNVVIS